jgi:two-component system response regulator AtoC
MEHERKTEDPAAGLESTERVSSASPSAPHLLIVAADGTWTSRPLPAGGALTIGRGDVDVRIDERAVSRRHARLEVAGPGDLRLVDLGSANGTVVGDRRVHSAGVMLRPGEPILIGRTVLSVHAAVSEQAAEPAPRPLGTGPMLVSVAAMVDKAAPTLIRALLLGETGVGKDVVAEQIHRRSTRAAGPLVRVNCAGLSAALLESELFGHEKGAFTGAAASKPGLLEAAAGGTVFLDEIGEMPLEVQAKLLLVIEQRVVRRVGATRSTPIDVRFISATHRDLEAEVSRGRFRNDFYYRINGLTIRIPPLRERRDEIDGLVALFAREVAADLRRPRPPAFEPEARAWLHHHSWPGNVRELRHVIERAVLFADDGTVTARVLVAAGLPAGAPVPSGSPEEAERARTVEALASCGHNQTRAARMLGISRNTLIARMRRWGLVRPRAQEAR